MSKQSDAWEHYERFGRYRDAERNHSMIWTHGYLSASRPLCALLGRIEWEGWNGNSSVGACPCCCAVKPEGHAVGCELDAYLSEERARREAWGEVPA